jgi:hypothetical protein
MDFLEEYKTAILIAGTVMFPSPFPASARVSIISPPASLGLGGDFIKIVQVISDTHFAVWMTPLDALKAARVPANMPTGPGPFAGWLLREGDDLQTDISHARDGAPSNTDEIPLYPRAIVFVADSAPVISRHEIVTTAEEAAEEHPDFFCPVCPPPGCHKK